MYEWRIGKSCIYKNHLDLVFSMKYRRNVFTAEVLECVKGVMDETCKQMDCELLEFGGEDDHIHLMVAVHPKVAVSNLVSKLKGKSSYVLRRDYRKSVRHKLWGNHFWRQSYCVVSCGGASPDVVKAYIEQQQAPPSEKSVKQSLALHKVN